MSMLMAPAKVLFTEHPEEVRTRLLEVLRALELIC